MGNRILPLALGLVLAGHAPLSAGELVDQAVKAEKFLDAGKHEDAVRALEAAQDALWAKVPLLFRRAVFTAGEPTGFGLYDLHENNSFKRSEPLIIYAEPMGFGYSRDGSLYVVDLGLDFIVKSAAGAEIAKQEKFGNLTTRSRFPNKEFFAKVTYDFSGLQPGSYTVTTVVHDKPTGKTGEFTLAFTLTD